MLKQKVYSAIKILGFALGIAACLLIALFVRNELNYDRNYPGAERIYRLIGISTENGITRKGTSMPAPMASVLKADFPEIESTGRMMPNKLFDGAGSNYIRTTESEEKSLEQGFTYIDQELLTMLKLPMFYGNREGALSQPNSIVFSRKKAEKFVAEDFNYESLRQNVQGLCMQLGNSPSIVFHCNSYLEDSSSALIAFSKRR